MKNKVNSNTKNDKEQKTKPIAQNKKALFDYFLEEKFEAGIELMGWEVKSLRMGKVNITDSYIIFRLREAYIIGSMITPLLSASTHVHTNPSRTRKLLLSKKQINYIKGKIDRSGYTCVSSQMYWKGQFVKLQIALAKGKKSYDKRAVIKEREWNISKQRILKQYNT